MGVSVRTTSKLVPHGRITLCLFDAELAPDYQRARRLRDEQRWQQRISRRNTLTNNGLALLASAINWAAIQNQNAGWGNPIPSVNLGDIWGAVGSSSTATTVNDQKLGAEIGRAIIANGVAAVTQVGWDFFFGTTLGNGTIWEAAAFAQSVGPPPTPTIANVGAAGATTYSYQVVAVGGAGGGDSLPSQTATTTTGNASLNSTNYNAISWIQVPSATGYKVIRTAGPGSTGFIGGLLPPTQLSLNDQGLAAAAYVAALIGPGTMLDHTVFVSSTVKTNSQTAILEVALTLTTS